MNEKEGITVNDGNGLYDNTGLCNSLILDLNNIPKLLLTGQYIQFCAMISSMGQRLVNLKEGIKSDMDSMNGKVEDLKRANDHLMKQINEIAEKDGAENGEN